MRRLARLRRRVGSRPERRASRGHAEPGRRRQASRPRTGSRAAGGRRATLGPFLLPERIGSRRGTGGTSAAQRRLAIYLVLTFVAAIVLVGRLAQLQLVDARASRAAADAMTTRAVVVPAVRGRILAADGSVLVGNGSTTTLTITPDQLRRPENAHRILSRVAHAIDRPVADLERRTATCGTKGAAPAPVCFSGQPFEPVPIASDVPTEAVSGILEQPERYPGVAATTRPTRTYGPSGSSLAQVLGYLTTTTADDVTAAREAGREAPATTALLGRAGLEQQYDTQLRGRDGRRVVSITPTGEAERVVADEAPTNGADVRTSLDPGLQKSAADALTKGIAAARKGGSKADSGSVVVMDADSGQVAALTNQPTYDPSVWNGGITQAEWDTLTRGGSDPLSNRAVTVAGPPASTFKAVSLFGAAAAGVDPKGTYDCPSSLRIGNRTFTNFESEAHGRIDIPTALEVSCDTVFYRWAYRSWLDAGGAKASVDAPDAFAAAARTFGFGARTGVDLPGEASGAVTDRAQKRRDWEATRAQSCDRAKRGYPEVTDKARAAYLKQVAQENCTSGYVLHAGDAVNLAIGQGDVSATPLQMAATYAAVATGGTRVTPTLVPNATSAQTETTSLHLDPAMLAVERDGLARVLRSGTASDAFAGFDLARFPISGKTGTAEVYGKQATAWFASYMPEPVAGHRYVVVVRVDQGGEGGRVAAPIGRAVWDAIARRGA